MTELFGVLAGIIGIVGYLPYIYDIFRGTTRPDRTSWLIWAVEYSVLFYAQDAAGASGSLWLIGLQLVGVLIVFGLSLKFGVGGFTAREFILLLCIGASMAVWYFTKSAGMAIYVLVAVEASGVVLTAVKTYRQPGSETLTMWMLVGVAGAVGLPAIHRGSPIALYVYPGALMCMSASVLVANRLGVRKKTAVPVLTEQEAIEELD